jgi:hypothetical protein
MFCGLYETSRDQVYPAIPVLTFAKTYNHG